MKILYIIPARGGSKGIPHKNIKPLNGKPLIYYTIDVARQLTSDENICVSSDDAEIIQAVEDYGLKVPFKRPDHLSTDTATTNDVLLHALNFYQSKGINYEVIILLQPTSPLRTVQHVREAMDLYDNKLDMVVSVKKSHAASVLCFENDNGYLEFCFNKSGSRRQDFSSYYEYNGAIYIINVERLKEKGLSSFTKKKKYVMDELTSFDIDIPLDLIIVESILKMKNSNLNV
ncbi:cytidylyltransferase domain-containing protein [Anaerorudis cellulosivorans]|uniref:acylneuraminate cytidylyltransferase family protein n=1 Tax=Anaerorudis cellulosivorans TaxID=3397862 RepID=UPI00221E8CE6|nr:acylneuraminate cytidylyltransferase family protein [Seramator thermalis]MCW1735285.1 acylneuraminate cytidylyltransferase family protein [Seramator thermalis]